MPITVGIQGKVDERSFKAAQREINNLGKSIGFTEKKAKTTKGTLGGLSLNTIGLGAAVAGTTAFLKSSVDAYMQSEASAQRLRVTLSNLGMGFENAKGQAEAFVQQQSVMSAVDDELVSDTFTRLINATKDYGDAQKLTTTALDISAATGKDASAVAVALGKAYNGNLGALSRFGVSVDKSKTSVENIDAAMKQYQGQAKAFGETSAGEAKKAQIAWENAQEGIGKGILDLAKPMLEWATNQENITVEYRRLMREAGKNPYQMFADSGIMAQAKQNIEDIATAKSNEEGITGKLTTAENQLADARNGAAKATRDERAAIEESNNRELAALNAADRYRKAKDATTDAIKKYGAKSREARIAILEEKIALAESSHAANAYKGQLDRLRDAANRAKNKQRDLRLELERMKTRYVTNVIVRNKNVSVGGHVSGGVSAHAEGGVFSRPHLGIVAEAGPEAIVPLSNPRRASQVMQEAGIGGNTYHFYGYSARDKAVIMQAIREADSGRTSATNRTRTTVSAYR